MSKYTIREFGPILFQTDWDRTGWYYINRQNEKVNMRFFLGSIDAPEGDVKLYQIIIGPFMLSWGIKR